MSRISSRVVIKKLVVVPVWPRSPLPLANENRAGRCAFPARELDGQADQMVLAGRDAGQIDPFQGDDARLQQDLVRRNQIVECGDG